MPAVIDPSWQDTFHVLHETQTLDALWIVLLVPHGIGSSSAWEEPYFLFQRFHSENSSGAATTALLLCTDNRWRKAAHHLIHALTDSDLLDDHALDQLATWFTEPGLEVLVPKRLFAGAPVVFIPSHARTSASTVELPQRKHARANDGHRVASVRVHRDTWPPLRRWAAARLMQSAATGWRHLVDIADDLPSRDAAMILAGVMDAVDTIAEDDRATVIEIGLSSASGIVRLAALPALALLEGIQAAEHRASADRSANVRAWATKPSSKSPLALALQSDPDPGDQPPGDADQPTLF